MNRSEAVFAPANETSIIVDLKVVSTHYFLVLYVCICVMFLLSVTVVFIQCVLLWTPNNSFII